VYSCADSSTACEFTDVCLCMFVCVRVYVYVCVCVCVYVYWRASDCSTRCRSIGIYVCVCVYVSVCVCVHVFVDVLTRWSFYTVNFIAT